MSRRLRKALAAMVLWTVMLAAPVWAIKVWNSTEIIQVADLNSNFSTINTAATALVTDAKVSNSAAISHAKLAVPTLVPKAWGFISGCVATPCTVMESYKISSVTRTSAGVYVVNLAGTWNDPEYAAILTPAGTANTSCVTTSRSALSFTVVCVSDTGAATDVGLNFVIMDLETVL